MERKIGEVFTYDGKTYQVVKSILCTHCAFNGKLCGLIGPSAGKNTGVQNWRNSYGLVFL